MDLRRYCETLVDTIGLVHQSNLRALRNYIKMQDIESLRKEVSSLNTAPTMKALWEAGVPKNLQEAYFQRLRELGG